MIDLITILGIAAIASLTGFASAKALDRSFNKKLQKTIPAPKPKAQLEQPVGLEEGIVEEVVVEEEEAVVEEVVVEEKVVAEEAVVEEMVEETVEQEIVLEKLPFSSISPSVVLTRGIHEFIETRFTHFEQNSPPPMMLLAQSTRNQAPMINALLTQAEMRYQTSRCLHIQLPDLPETDTQSYFAILAQQCGFPETVHNSIEFEQALLMRLNQHNSLFVLISRFEHSPPPIQQQLAGIVRSLNESHANQLLMVLCGSEKLAQLKYLHGSHSLLNIAQEYHWPELEPADVYALRDNCCPNLVLDDEITKQLLAFSGGHPILLHRCLRLYQHNPTLVWQDYPSTLSLDPFVWRFFIPFQAEMPELREWLTQTEIAPASALFSYGSKRDTLIQRLYWNNLLTERHKHLCWRCEALRLAGNRVL